ncbi:MAG TPA: hypothetical protein PLA94_07355 [Myxococcota bacterium]|nr:hypothetical protein [Myxococcota bacterium]
MAFSLIGAKLGGRFEVLELLAGEPLRGLYRVQEGAAGRCLLACVPGSWGEEEEEAFRVDLPGLAALVYTGELRWEGARLRVVVEKEPSGGPLWGMLRVPTVLAEISRILKSLVDLAEALEATGRIWPLHPRILYPQARGVVAAARCGALLELAVGEFKKPALEPTLDAPDVLKGQARTIKSVVFQICAIGAWLRWGAPPFGNRLEEELRAHMGAAEGERGLGDLEVGLARAPELRPDLAGLRQRLTGPGLGERLSVPQWYCAAAVGEEGPRPVQEGGRWRLVRRWERSGAYLELPAPECFLHLGEGLVELDSGSPTALECSLAELRARVEALEVEAILAGQSRAPLATLRDYRGYRILVREGPTGSQLATAPDGRGRRLAAVFTTSESLGAFRAQLMDPTLTGKLLTGQELYPFLLQLPLEGIVFNCAGPGAPRAVALELARRVLEG